MPRWLRVVFEPSSSLLTSRTDWPSVSLSGSDRIAKCPKLPRARFSAGAGEGVDRICQLGIDEARSPDHCFPACARQGAGDSTCPEVDVAKRLLRHGPFETDVRDGHAASGAKHPKDLPIDAQLVWTEIDHAIRDDDVGPPVLNW